MELSNLFLFAGIALLIVAWLIVFVDIFRNRFPDRTMWIIFSLTTPPLTVLVYPLIRNKLIKYSKKK